jgi:hypothetical protein
LNRYYFTIPSANIWEVVYADTFEHAKHLAYKDYSDLWNQIEWVHQPFPVKDGITRVLEPHVEMQPNKLRGRRRRITYESASQHSVAHDTTAPDNVFA